MRRVWVVSLVHERKQKFLTSGVFPPLPADLSAAKRKFADSLNEFKFLCIGDAETDDEICIGESWAPEPWGAPELQTPQLSRIENASEVLITPLEKFRKEQIGAAKADSQVDLVRQHFYEVSLEYVFKVQEVQERKMFEFVEPVCSGSLNVFPGKVVMSGNRVVSQGGIKNSTESTEKWPSPGTPSEFIFY
ncbi:rho gtpase-activating protein 26-like [Limosa lapponica baueri]|uniref:Rho gtpase-activating protein 26-like n=1 Tax=Limosa lapponica baueri TaxID=1758121 RepID=A0A2I0T8Z7_LIMLA|nr:rho gtpase-activating protein 26-like [Limosa lapponica baueri]